MKVGSLKTIPVKYPTIPWDYVLKLKNNGFQSILKYANTNAWHFTVAETNLKTQECDGVSSNETTRVVDQVAGYKHDSSLTN